MTNMRKFKIMQLWGLYNLFNCLWVIGALVGGGFALYPYLGLSVVSYGMILLLVYIALETSFYVRLWYLVDAQSKVDTTNL